MKNEQQEQAKNLYFQTNLSKSEIAALLDVSRTTVHSWVRDGDWDRLKRSATHLPSLLAEKCYHIIGHYTDHLLSGHRDHMPIQKQEADTLYRIVVTLNKLKNRNSINDSMEMFGFFLDGLKAKAPRLAGELLPYMEEYISSRAAIYPENVAPGYLDGSGYIPLKEKDDKEEELDQQDFMEWQQQGRNAVQAANNNSGQNGFRSEDNDTGVLAA
jgi:predicted transcriptional regulator